MAARLAAHDGAGCRRRLESTAGFALALLAFAQSFPRGPQVLTFLSDIDDSDQPYALYLPGDFDASKQYPLVISLHGAGSNHRLNMRRLFGRGNLPGETDAEATRYFPRLRDVEYIVASPYARGSMGYRGVTEHDVYDVLADVKRRFQIDEDRVYLTGLSMGGGGALWLGLTRPDVWAAIAPVCAAAPTGTEALAPNALNLPVHLFHGDRDPAVPVESSRQWHKRLLELGTNAEYVEYPGVRHNSWDFAYRNGALFDWFTKFRRVRYPERVRFVTQAYKYDKAYWVRIDGLTPGSLAEIDARFTGRNQLAIATHALNGFTLEIAGHPQYAAGRPLEIAVDGHPLRGTALSYVRTAKGWKPGRYQPPAGAKRPGLEGPLAEAVASRHIYVYGTADSPGAEEVKHRRDVATQASEWSQPRARLMISFAVKADKDVTAKDLESANLVLFGTRETNSLIARFAPLLPVALNAGAADYGLAFVAPVNGRYVVINSGLPWWTGADEAKRPAVPFRTLDTFGDFVLFKGSLENIMAEGRFDRNWKLPAEAAKKMAESGAISGESAAQQ